MEEKLIEQEEPTVEKKVYTPPAVTVYGNLTELTAGGSGVQGEPNPGQPNQPPFKHP